MRQALMRKAKRGQAVSEIRKIPAPVKGWYTADSVAEAPKGTALVIDNWFCEPDALRLRKGSVEHADGLGSGSVDTLMSYQSGSVSKLFGACDGDIFDVSSAGSVGAAAVSGLMNSRLQYTNFATSGGQFLICVNGADAPPYYNGTSWSTLAITLSAVDIGDELTDVWQHKERLWFTRNGSADAYYLAVDAIQGALGTLALGSFLTRGGYLLAGASWSVDAGDGMDDLNVYVSSEGEVLVFAGTDPSSSNEWGLVGVYRIGKPVGRRCLYKVGGDLLVICRDGLLPLSKVIKTDKAVLSDKALTKAIRTAFRDAVTSYSGVFGWQMVTLPQKNMAILNVPTQESVAAEQYAMNTLTGAWSRFTGWNAACWEFFEDAIYYGAPGGVVAKAETGASDLEAAIEAYVIPAYDDLGMPAVPKHIKLVKPLFVSNVAQAPAISIAVDYEEPLAGSSSEIPGLTGFTWDVSLWDGPDLWAGANVYRFWQSGGNIGAAISPATAVTIDEGGEADDLVYRLIAYHVVFEGAAIFG